MVFAATLVVVALGALCAAGSVHAKGPVPVPYRGTLTGKAVAFAVAGMEPDFDLINRVVLSTTLRARGYPPLYLILDAYLENFQPDTTPVLPDILNGKTTAQNLGGFFQGEAIIVDPARRILYAGSMLAEAFLDSSNHMVVTATGRGPAAGGTIRLKSRFRAFERHKELLQQGTVWGTLSLPAAARHALTQGPAHGAAPGSYAWVQPIVKQFNVPVPPMRGTAGTGKPTKPFKLYGLPTNPSKTSTGSTPTHASGRPTWMAPLGAGLIALAALLFVFWLWQERTQRRTRPATSVARDADDRTHEASP